MRPVYPCFSRSATALSVLAETLPPAVISFGGRATAAAASPSLVSCFFTSSRDGAGLTASDSVNLALHGRKGSRVGDETEAAIEEWEITRGGRQGGRE